MNINDQPLKVQEAYAKAKAATEKEYGEGYGAGPDHVEAVEFFNKKLKGFLGKKAPVKKEE